jgi:hypothetical protein
MLYPRKHFDTSGKSAAPLHHRAICKTAHGAAHRNYGASAMQVMMKMQKIVIADLDKAYGG